ncbi:MAG TPA: ABC transporter ATP-binding protein [bacterium]|nr:ABC transporter ATP-binding protein [bacterium]
MNVIVDEDQILGRAYDARLMGRLLRYVRPYRRVVAWAIAFLLAASASDLAGPLLYRIAIDRYIAPHTAGTQAPGPAADIRGLAGIAALYLAILGAGFAARWLQSNLMQYVGQRVMADLRVEMFDHLQTLSMGFFSRTPIGRLVTRLTNDVDALNELITSGVVAIFGDIATLVGITAIMLWMDWRLALAAFTVLPLVYLVTERFRQRSRGAYRAVRTRLARLNAFLNEHVMGMTVTQLFNQQRRSLRCFGELNSDLLDANLDSTWNFSQFYPAIQLLGAIGIAVLLWYGGGQTVRHMTTLGVLVATIQYAERFFDPLRDLSEKFNILQAAMASSERIFRVLDEPVTVQDPLRPAALPRARGRIEFRNVWFAYDTDEPWALRDVTFALEPGEAVALVGHTGAGKTSILNLLTRFYDPQRGQVLIDGVDVREVRQQELRRRIGLVLQDVFLFAGTVESNIRLGNPDLTVEEVRRAAERVGAHRFIEALPGGYAAELKERGAGLSGGQKQLIALARALAANPEILLVLDEATSSVDTETETLIRDAMATVLRGRTSITIAHRLSTVQHADRILVVHRGRIVEEGRHSDLLRRNGIYAKLYRLQFEAQERGFR